MNLDFLKPILGEELFGQVADKLKGSGVTLANISDGSYIPKAKFDEQLDKVKQLTAAVGERDEQLKAERGKNASVDALNQQIAQLTKDVADRDGKLSELTLDYHIRDDVRAYKPRDVDVIIPLLDRSKITEKDGKLVGLSEQMDALTQNKGYLFDGDGGGRGGFLGNQDLGGGAKSANATMNQALRTAAGRG